MKNVLPLLLCSLFLCVNTQAVETPAAASGAESTKATPSTEKTAPSRKTGARPVYASVTEVNAETKTVKLGETSYTITEKTEFHNNGQPAAFSDVKPGAKIGGSWVERNGKRELVKVNVGVKQTATRASGKTAAPAKEM